MPLSLFGMARQRPIGEAPSNLFIDDAHDPARSSQCHQRRSERHDNGRTSLDHLPFREDPDSGHSVSFPGLETVDSSLEDVRSATEDCLIAVW